MPISMDNNQVANEDSSPPGGAATSTLRLCPICGRSFSRSEHLRRHQLTHSKAANAHACRICHRQFSRRDALLRHEAGHVTPNAAPAVLNSPRRTHACLECAKARTRCSGESPCQRCVKKNLMCEHRLRKRRETQYTQVANAGDQQRGATEIQDVAIAPPSSLSSKSPAVEYDQVQPQVSPWLSQVVPGSSSEGHWPREDQDAGSLRIVDLGMADSAVSSIGHNYGPMGSLSQVYPNWLPFNMMDESLAFELEGPISTFSTVPQRTAADEPLNEILSSATDQIFLNPIPSGSAIEVNMYPDHTNCSVSRSSHMESTLSPCSTGTGEDTIAELKSDPRYVGYAVGLGARNTRYDGKTKRIMRHRLRSESQLRRTAASISSKSPKQLASRESELACRLDATSAKTYMTDHQYETSLKYYEEARSSRTLSKLLQSTPQPFPPLRLLNWQIYLYLCHFHPDYPFLDSQKLDRHEIDWPLLIALAAIGSIYAPPKSARGHGELLHAFLYTHLTNIHSDGGLDESLEYVQTKALNIVGLCQTSKTALVERGYKERDLLSGSCFRLALLKHRNQPALPHDGPLSGVNWRAWREREEYLRTGLFVWMLDCILAYTSDFHARFQLDDLQLELPCEEALWQTDKFDEWTYLHAKRQDTQTVRDALEELHVRSYIRPSVSNFGRIIIIHSLFEWNWQVQRFYTNKLSQWTPTAARKPPSSVGKATSIVPYPASIPQISAWRNSACDCLDVLHWEALSVSSKTGGIESPLFLVLHLARLILLTPVSHLRTLAEYRRNHGASGTGDPQTWPSEYELVVRCWFTSDKYKCRLAVLHAGAIYWHIRRYSSDAILQPFAAFLATLVLWAYATYSSAAASGPEISSANLEGGTNPNPGSVARNGAIDSNATTMGNPPDWTGADPIADEMDEVSPWSDSETSTYSTSQPRAPSFMHLDRPFDDELAQHFIRSADTMRAFVDGVGDLCTTVPANVLQEGVRLLREKCRKWEISKIYSYTLEDLMLHSPLS